MKAKNWLGVITGTLMMISAFTSHTNILENHHKLSDPNDKLKKEALQILKTKCNVCHRKQNPFMIFKEKNMSKKAKKIYKMVFVERRMPKGNEIRLTEEEYNQLEKWLKTQEIY